VFTAHERGNLLILEAQDALPELISEVIPEEE
jgi:hypothetical protein